MKRFQISGWLPVPFVKNYYALDQHYDLRQDPRETTPRANNPEYAAMLKMLLRDVPGTFAGLQTSEINKMIKPAFLLYLLLISNVVVAGNSAVLSPPVDAPQGYRWVLNGPYSDEFNGTELDGEKWKDYYPGWEGRIPGKFVPSSIRVNDGFLQIKSTVLDPPQGCSNEWTIACGAVQSKAGDALYGYYETRMKASDISTSSTFWLKNVHDDAERPYTSTELDIMECIGNAQRWPNFKDHMMSNTHVEKIAADPEEETLVAKEGAEVKLDGFVSEAFHTYGCWWVDANTMKFYLDGKYVYTITPPTDIDPTPFDHPMFVNMVCEIYTWEVLPTVEELLDDSRNTTLYDYVRSFKLMKDDE